MRFANQQTAAAAAAASARPKSTAPVRPGVKQAGMPSGLSAVKPTLSQQQAQYDKNMKQASALPAGQRAIFAKQFQEAAARGDASTIRPGMGQAFNESNIKRASGDARRAADQQSQAKMQAAKTMPAMAARRAADQQSQARMQAAKTMPANVKSLKTSGGAIGAALGKKLGMKSGGAVGAASKRADGCAVKGKTKGKML